MTRLNRTTQALVCALFLFASSHALGQGDVAAGKEKSQLCATCHGEFGNESIDPTYPKLAGQYASYLVKALQGYQNGERQNAVMQGFTATLSEEDIEDLAAYFAAQSGLRDLKIK